MSKPITYWAETPAIVSLCKIYGPRWEEMPMEERTAIMTAISAGIHAAVKNDKADAIEVIAQQLIGDLVSHPSLYPLLAQLDKDLDNLQEVLYLVAGIAMSTPLRELGAA